MKGPGLGRIPLIRPSIGREELAEVRKVLESGWLAQGPKVREFEAKLAEYIGARYVVVANSCTSALSLALQAFELKPGSEVVFPDFTFPATGNVVATAGFKPVIADVELETYSVSVDTLKRAISPRTSAIIPVHPFGFPVPLDEIYEFAGKRGIEVVEDAATAFGTIYHGRKVGSRGRAVCFSFHPRKALTTGEGGCIVTDDQRIYELTASFRNHGQVYSHGKPTFVSNGLNYRMSDINAAVGVAQLKKFDGIIASRRKKASFYEAMLEKSRADIYLQRGPENAIPTFQSYVVRLGRKFRTPRDICIESLSRRNGIETQVGTYSLSVQPSFSRAKKAAITNGPVLFESTLTLPLYESLSGEQQQFVVDSLVALS